jgi:hypothetical protein
MEKSIPPKTLVEAIDQAIQEYDRHLENGVLPMFFLKYELIQVATSMIFAINEYGVLLALEELGRYLPIEQRQSLKHIRSSFLQSFPDVQSIRGTEMHYDERIKNMMAVMKDQLKAGLEALGHQIANLQEGTELGAVINPLLAMPLKGNSGADARRQFMDNPHTLRNRGALLPSEESFNAIAESGIRSALEDDIFSSYDGKGNLRSAHITEESVNAVAENFQSVLDIFKWSGMPIVHPIIQNH